MRLNSRAHGKLCRRTETFSFRLGGLRRFFGRAQKTCRTLFTGFSLHLRAEKKHFYMWCLHFSVFPFLLCVSSRETSVVLQPRNATETELVGQKRKAHNRNDSRRAKGINFLSSQNTDLGCLSNHYIFFIY